MSLLANPQFLQYTAWVLALLQCILGLYIVVLNARHNANRHVSVLVFLVAINAYAVGALATNSDPRRALLPTYLIAATSFPITVTVFLTTVVLLRPQWLRGRWRWALWIAYAAAFFPPIQTFIDGVLGTGIWYAGFDLATYTGGYILQRTYINDLSFSIAQILYGFGFGFLPFVPIIAALRDQRISSDQRRLAWWLLGIQVISVVLQGFIRPFLPSVLRILFVTTVLSISYTAVAFRQMVLEHRVQRGSLQRRLTLLILIIAVPVLVAGVGMVGQQAQQEIEQSALERLFVVTRSLEDSLGVWLDFSIKTSQEMAMHPDIISMEPQRQQVFLEAAEAIYPNVYLVSTVDLNGVGIARSGGSGGRRYDDREWFQAILDGEAVALQILDTPTSVMPVLEVARPILVDGVPVGIVMFASNLNEVFAQVYETRVGSTGKVYIVTPADQLIVHTDLDTAIREGRDFSAVPPVQALRDPARAGTLIRFVDAEGVRWWAYGDVLDDYGWGLVVQQQEAELLGKRVQFRQISLGVIFVGVILLVALSYFTIRQAFQPIQALTETASAIAEGDLTRVAQVESKDEIGDLARTFNSVTAQLNDLISSLEDRVAERTQEVERRAEYLSVTAGVSRVAASILDVDELLNRVVHLIAERFDFYHAGIFLLDDDREWAVLRAVSSEGGRRMLARGHRLRVGEQGIVGYASGFGRPRIALDVDEDVVWVKNPDLPETRSEMALPLISGQDVIGVLDVQSQAAEAFSAEDVSTLRILADQVAVAIQNARLFQERQRAFEELRRTYGAEVRQGWAAQPALLKGYQYTPAAVTSLSSEEIAPLESVEAMEILEDNILAVPLQLSGGQTYGALRLQRPPERPWTTQEIGFVHEAAQDIAQALEVARLLAETRQRAARDRMLSEVGGRLRASLNPDVIMRKTVRELGRVLGARFAAITVTGPASEDQDGQV